jgi:hypothetical protein
MRLKSFLSACELALMNHISWTSSPNLDLGTCKIYSNRINDLQSGINQSFHGLSTPANTRFKGMTKEHIQIDPKKSSHWLHWSVCPLYCLWTHCPLYPSAGNPHLQACNFELMWSPSDHWKCTIHPKQVSNLSRIGQCVVQWKNNNQRPRGEATCVYHWVLKTISAQTWSIEIPRRTQNLRTRNVYKQDTTFPTAIVYQIPSTQARN